MRAIIKGVTDNPRIRDLRRRVLKDPASIASGELAEDTGGRVTAKRPFGCARRVWLSTPRICRRGSHSAGPVRTWAPRRARAEFLRVLDAAPDNLVAVGNLAEIDQRTQQGYRRASEDHAQAPGKNRDARSADERVLLELQAWLDAIGQRRLARQQ